MTFCCKWGQNLAIRLICCEVLTVWSSCYNLTILLFPPDFLNFSQFQLQGKVVLYFFLLWVDKIGFWYLQVYFQANQDLIKATQFIIKVFLAYNELLITVEIFVKGKTSLTNTPRKNTFLSLTILLDLCLYLYYTNQKKNFISFIFRRWCLLVFD